MIGLPQLRGNLRLGLWCLLCLLTLLIFLYPAQLYLRYAPVESIYVFQNLPLFGVLYYIWFALILVLLFFPGGKQGSRDWENVALVVIFTLVFSGIWQSLSHGKFGSDTFVHAGTVKFSLPKGHLFYPFSTGPIELPTIALLGLAVNQIAGLQIFDMVTLIVLFQILLFPILFYVLFGNLLKDGRLASIATLMTVGGNILYADFLPQFHPRIFVMLFVVLFLALLAKDKPAMSRSSPHTLLSIILVAAITVTHTVSPLVLFLILSGIYLVQRLSKANLITLPLVIFSFVFYYSYGIYIAKGLSGYVVSQIPLMWANLLKGQFLSALGGVAITNNVGVSIPLWANIAIIFWLLLMVLGGLLGFRNLLRLRRLNQAQQMEIGALIGVAIFMIIDLLPFGMMDVLFRVFFFLPLFTVPILLRSLSSLRAHARRLALAVLIVLIFVLSFPSFLALNDNVSSASFLPTEVSPAEFVGANYKETRGLAIVTSQASISLTPYYVPDISSFVIFPFGPFGPFGPFPELDEFYRQMDGMVKTFKDNDEASISLFIFSPRYAFDIQTYYGTDPTTDPRWQKAFSQLAQANMIYNNGRFQIYQARGRRGYDPLSY
jgi:hypothetical protein